MSDTLYPATRRNFCKHLAAAAATTLYLGGTAATVQASSQGQSIKSEANGINVLLVHGAYVDASSWLAVITRLQAQGYNALAVQLPLVSLADDILVTRQALETLSGPTILAGHSYGGAVISSIGLNDDKVRGLVFADAFALDEGESAVDVASKFPTPPINAFVGPSPRPGFVWVAPQAFPANFVQDIPLAQAQALAVVQKPINPQAFTEKSGPPAWKKIPSWTFIGLNDRALNPEAQRFMAKRCGATIREVPSSHASPVSHPQEVFEVIVAAATGRSTVMGRG